MIEQLTVGGIALASGAVLAQEVAPGAEILDKVGVAGIAVMVVYWMLTTFSRRLDKLTESIDRLAERSQGK